MAKKIPQQPTDLPASATQAYAQDQGNAAVVAAAEQMVQDKLDANQLLGRLQAVLGIKDTLEASALMQLQQIKDAKAYKQFAGQTMLVNGESVRLDTWEGFCLAVGSSRRVIEEKLDNLLLLGENALAKAEALGITRNELRKLRQLDAADQKAIIGEIEVAVGDKDAIIDLITDMSARHVKEKEAM